MTVFPFSAVVGHGEAKLALMLAAVEPMIGGVLLRGQKGSAKTTLARGLAALLAPGAPFVELPVGATEDRLVGSIDLAAALTGGEVRFSPGLLAAAHGGVLYVDEVNLLADHLVDVLLDVAVSGVNRVEREGISHLHPSRFVLIGSMNPEEGELRPQLLDRFGLAADVVASIDPDERALAVHRRLAFDTDPVGFGDEWSAPESAASVRLVGVAPGSVSGDLLRRVCALCASVGAEGLRADLVITRAAAALAGLEGRSEATIDEVRRVAALALAHRRRRHPLQDPGMADDELQSAIDDTELVSPTEDDQGASNPGGSEGGSDRGDAGNDDASKGSEFGDDNDGPGPRSQERTSAPGIAQSVARIEARRAAGGADGRRSMASGARGRVVGDCAPDGASLTGGVAVGATVRAAAARSATTAEPPVVPVLPHAEPLVARVLPGAEPPVVRVLPHAEPPVVRVLPHAEPLVARVLPGDVRAAVREQRTANLIVLAVDASGSMGTDRRMEAAKGALLGLLLDAYQRRDRVALVTFRGEGAEVVLRPTGSVEIARARLTDLATGGRTPLAAGIETATALAVEARRRGGYQPLAVIVTDGRATAAPADMDPWTAALAAASEVARNRIPCVVVDAEDGLTRLGLAGELAEAMGAAVLTIEALTASALRSLLV